MPQLPTGLQDLVGSLAAFLGDHAAVMAWYTAVVRFLFPVLAILILIRSIRSLLTVPHVPEVWAYLTLPNGLSEPLTHWENFLGRSGACDVILGYPTVSRQHAALIRAENDSWTIYDLGSKGGVTLNGKPVSEAAPVAYGDVLALGGRGDRPPARPPRGAGKAPSEAAV